MKKKILIIAMVFLLITNNIVFALDGYTDKVKSYLLADYESGEIIDSYNIDTPIELASTSKLLSYFVIKDEISKGNISYNDVIVIDEDTASITGSSYKLKAGEEFTVDKLLKACIIISGNDATYALAKHIAGTEEAFVGLMKKKADSLGLKSTELYNSSGLPINGLQNKMTTRELYILVRNLLDKYPEVLELSKTPIISEPAREFLELNTNPLLRTVENVDGLKTGFTNKAGYCLVSTMNIRGEVGKSEDLRLIGVVMGASNFDDRTDASKKILEYGKNNYSKRIILHEKRPIQTLDFKSGKPNSIQIYPEMSFSKFLLNSTDISLDIKLNDVKPPINQNTYLGQVTVLEDGKPIFTTNLINKEEVDTVNILDKIFNFYDILFRKQNELFK